MEPKSARPDIRLEPRLHQRLKEFAAARDMKVSALVRDLIIQRLRAENALSADDLRVMRGIG